MEQLYYPVTILQFHTDVTKAILLMGFCHRNALVMGCLGAKQHPVVVGNNSRTSKNRISIVTKYSKIQNKFATI